MDMKASTQMLIECMYVDCIAHSICVRDSSEVYYQNLRDLILCGLLYFLTKELKLLTTNTLLSVSYFEKVAFF